MIHLPTRRCLSRFAYSLAFLDMYVYKKYVYETVEIVQFPQPVPRVTAAVWEDIFAPAMARAFPPVPAVSDGVVTQL